MNAALRAWAMLVDPPAEWRRIAQESGDPAYLLNRYVAMLAVIPALSGFVGTSVIGTTTAGAAVTRTPLFDGVFGAVFGYVMTCAVVLLVGLLIDLAAPLFGGKRDFDSAFTLAVYAFTPVWLAGIFLVLPGLHFLLLTGFYGAYVLWLGVPALIRMPEQKSPGFVVLIVACAGALLYLTAMLQHMVFGTPGL